MTMPSQLHAKFTHLLDGLYDQSGTEQILARIDENLSSNKQARQVRRRWNASDIMLITYGDSFASEGRTTLDTLRVFLASRLEGLISTVHILPFYPYTSDDGFAVSDYGTVDPNLGHWSDIHALRDCVDLMFDLPINHASSAHVLFKNFLAGEADATQYFLTAPAGTDITQVMRPRTSDLLQTFLTADGAKHVWCTFSRDQVDWDFRNPQVLCLFIDIVARYVQHGATWLRLDAIAYLWKELGTNCIHLPQTHAIVKLLRLYGEALNPQTTILTETNVPNEENLSYFGNGDEAHVVYNFSLPPLLLHGLLTGQSKWLSEWCQALPDLPAGCTYLNFTASHDGVGLRPAEGIIPQDELKAVFESMTAFGGLLTHRTLSDGTESPYEVNISLYDAFQGTIRGKDSWQKERFLCSQAVMLALAGIPALYYNSLLATPNYLDGVERTQRNRTINRRKWLMSDVDARLDDAKSDAYYVFQSIANLITVRRASPAFDPDAGQTCIQVDPRIFMLRRVKPSASADVLCIFNLSDQEVTLTRNQLPIEKEVNVSDLLSDRIIDAQTKRFTLSAYEVLWLQAR